MSNFILFADLVIKVISKENYKLILLRWGRLFTSKNKTIIDILGKIHQYEIRVKTPDLCTSEPKAEMLLRDLNRCDGLVVVDWSEATKLARSSLKFIRTF